MSSVNQLDKYQPYPEYKDSGVDWLGEIPKNWSTCAVWMRFYLGRGRVISNEEIQDNLGVYPVYSSQTLNEGVMGYIDTYDFNGDYITWTTDGANAGTVFTRAGKFNCTNVCGTLSASDPLKTNLRFYTYALSVASSWFVRHDINPKLMNNVMAGIRIPSLSPNEQRTIAAFLDYETARIDQLIAKQQQLIELLKEKRQAVISHAVTKGLNPNAPMKDTGVEWLGQVPKHWDVSALKRFWFVVDCKHITAEFFDEGIPLASIREVQSWAVDLSDAKKTSEEYYKVLIEGNRLPEDGDIIFSRNATVGEAARVTMNHPPFAMGQDVCLLKK